MRNPGPRPDGIAIIGMDGVFPGAPDRESFWTNLVAGTDSITAAPAERWEPIFYDPASTAIDRLYCRRGGFIGGSAGFDALKWGLMPVAAKGSEPDQMLALDVAGRALEDAGYAPLGNGSGREFPRSTTAVVLGRGGHVGPATVRLIQMVRTSQELAASLGSILPDTGPDEIERLKREYQARIENVGADTLIGLVPNLAASRIANRLDLHGPAYTVDAACASSLIAVHQACGDLAAGRCDLALAGGVHLSGDIVFWSVFCQLGALSRSERIRPFDRAADGLLIGEGVGVVVLKRLGEAERDGDRIYAVIRGTGVASDGRESSIMNPRVEGQRMALERAWRSAGLDPMGTLPLGLMEAHGTATPAGDQAELETLARFFGPPRPDEARAGLGSVKSMIGHAMPAAGIAGLIKAVLAIERRTLPPTLHCDDPHPDIERTRFRPLHQAEPWDSIVPRRAAVNAFGFGGINAHVVVEEHGIASAGRAGIRRRAMLKPDAAPRPALLLAASTPEDLARALERGAESGDETTGPCRIAILDPAPERIERALGVVRRGQPFRDRRGEMWFTPRGLLTGQGGLAFLYPGYDVAPPPALDEVARHFGRRVPGEPALPGEPAVAGGAEADGDEVAELERTGFAIFQTGSLLSGILGDLGLVPAFVAGQSLGEWTAMLACGALPEEGVRNLLASVEPGTLGIPFGTLFAAMGCGVDRLESILDDFPDVSVALDNCPHQAVICGPGPRVEAVVDRLRRAGVLCQILTFRSGFHSPLFHRFAESLEPIIEGLPLEPARGPLWSATTCAPYPADPEAMRRLLREHLVRPVRFRELTERLYAEGARAFVQVGTGSLVGFVDDTLRGRPHLAIPALASGRSALDQLRRVAAALWVEGAGFDHRRLLGAGAPVAGRRQAPVRLALGAPLVSVGTPLARPASSPNGDDPVARAFARTMDVIEGSRREVLAAWSRHSSEAPAARTTHRRISLATDPALVDHSFFDLPPGWPSPEDGFPVVPFTMSLSILMEAARDLTGGVPVGVERVRAWRWMAIENPVDLEIEARREGPDRVHVRLGPYLEGFVRLAAGYPPAPPAARGPLEDEQRAPFTPAEMYAERIMFHGPRYRSMVGIEAIGPLGIRGVVESLPAEGSLLDGAGQMLGLWIRQGAERDRIAMPVMLESGTFHGPTPPIGTRLECRVRVRHHGARQVRADIELSSNGRVWAALEGWEDRRMEDEPWTWTAIHRPQVTPLAGPHPVVPDCRLWSHTFVSARTRDYFARRYLSRREMARYHALDGKRKEEWLGGRIAAKDAVRCWLWERGHGPIYPIEVEIDPAPDRPPRVEGRFAAEMRVSIAHKDGIAVARAAAGEDLGIDLERIAPRGRGFEAAAFTPAERALLPDEERDEWTARFWAAKEAAAKRAGTGLAGSPGRFPVTGVLGEEIRIGDARIPTRHEGDRIVAWTEAR